MKNINDLLPSTTPLKTSVSVENKTNTIAQEQSASIVNGLFNELMMIKTGWRAMFPSIKEPEQLKRAMGKLKIQFMKGFIENNISTDQQIQYGLAKARSDDNPFFPSVGEFISWCQPDLKEYGLPSAYDAWREVTAHCHEYIDYPWKIQAMYEAGRRCGFYEIKRGSISEKQFSDVYKKVCEEVMSGAVFEMPVHETKNRLGSDHSMKTRTKTTENLSAHEKAMKELRK